ncbi:DUF488 family protein [Ktedonobacter robiniae]|uniref:DNA repair protein n=1 Tax=Ktedonobacter robiniae TaxID=2778365 RepID=A0ABQ3UY25_9CHLR|nr:DUF488 domain-containing protein [Ktedonobacter robiniae]GHO57573.1 hypothetical protein KSB_60480 [Ktedonobacter robiniae]
MRTLYTIGHSTRTFEQFLALLSAYAINLVVDVRIAPTSARSPQFNGETLAKALKVAHIGYVHLGVLGGHRRPTKDSPNQGWHNTSFRGYADYMATDTFRAGLQKLQECATKCTAAIMCAEAVPWRCHRSLIADALTVQDWQVYEIQSQKTAKLHRLTPFLRVHEGLLLYPATL